MMSLRFVRLASSSASAVGATSSPKKPLPANRTRGGFFCYNEKKTFGDLRLSPILLDKLRNLKITTPSRLQDEAIPALMAPRAHSTYVIGGETGSGKTLAYALPLVHRLLQESAQRENKDKEEVKREAEEVEAAKEFGMKKQKQSFRPILLIIVPTLELERQVRKVIKSLVMGTLLKCASSASLPAKKASSSASLGSDEQIEASPEVMRKAIVQDADIIVAIPYTARQLLEEEALDPNHIKYLVVDEADMIISERKKLSRDLRQVLGVIYFLKRDLIMKASPAVLSALAASLASQAAAQTAEWQLDLTPAHSDSTFNFNLNPYLTPEQQQQTRQNQQNKQDQQDQQTNQKQKGKDDLTTKMMMAPVSQTGLDPSVSVPGHQSLLYLGPGRRGKLRSGVAGELESAEAAVKSGKVQLKGGKRINPEELLGAQVVLVGATLAQKNLRKLLGKADVKEKDVISKMFAGARWIQSPLLHYKLPNLKYHFIFCAGDQERRRRLMALLEVQQEMKSKTLIFFNSTVTLYKVKGMTRDVNISASCVHDAMDPEDRQKSLDAFLHGDHDVMLCTNILARGIDFDVAHVVEYEMSKNVTDFLHRAGRTARAGDRGSVTSFYGQFDTAFVEALRRCGEGSLEPAFIKTALASAPPPSQLEDRDSEPSLSHDADSIGSHRQLEGANNR